MNSKITHRPVRVSDSDLRRLPVYLQALCFRKTGKFVQSAVERRLRQMNLWLLILASFAALAASAVAYALVESASPWHRPLLFSLLGALTLSVFFCSVRLVNALSEKDLESLGRFKGFVVDVCHYLGKDLDGLCVIKHERHFWTAAVGRLSDLASGQDREGVPYYECLDFLERCGKDGLTANVLRQTEPR